MPHLEYYNQYRKTNLEEFFQLGFTQYQLKTDKAAIKSLGELNLLDSNWDSSSIIIWQIATTGPEIWYQRGLLLKGKPDEFWKKYAGRSYFQLW
ncbi:MAG: hypothetical protein IPJ51_19960 [Saprospiraceae bacterium]|nr:hypothetical protein [Saprospiraceae bacterium]